MWFCIDFPFLLPWKSSQTSIPACLIVYAVFGLGQSEDLFVGPSPALSSSGLDTDLSLCLTPSSLHVPFFLVSFLSNVHP